MKKILLIFLLFFIGLSSDAKITFNADLDSEDFYSNNGVTMSNIWNKLGKREEKITLVGSKILNANKISKRVIFRLADGYYTVNASARYIDKQITVYKGLLNYIDNDDELAAILSHEIAHDMDYYKCFGQRFVMAFNKKSYEYKADLLGIDYMVKAGYNPIAMITIMNKIGGESVWDWGLATSHPKTSKRLIKDYEYIYKKYPKYLTSDMTKSIYYQTWINTAEKDIKNFEQREKERAAKREAL